MKFKIVYREENESIFPWKSRYRGVVLWPYVIMRPKKYTTGSVAQSELMTRRSLVKLYRHELQHCYQIKERGVIGFYVRYAFLSLVKGYWNHPDELEARQYENEKLTPLEEKWLHEGVVNLNDLDD